MAPNEPLFASERRGSLIHSEEQAADEDTALLGSQGKVPIAPRNRYGFWREVGLFSWAVLATAAVIVLAVLSQHQTTHQSNNKPKPTGKRNLIWTSRTRSTSSLVTDSAAGATAFSCGLKSYNGAISMLPDHTPCGTVLEAAKKAGYLTGLVVTTDITDATPACFASHVKIRMEEDLIAQQEVGEHPLGRG